MTKIVILGSCRFEPYTILCAPKKVKGKWNTEKGYEIAKARFYPAIKKCDEVWIYAPDGIGKHTQMDLDYAIAQGKIIKFIVLKLSIKEKLLNILGKLLGKHLHHFRYLDYKDERFAYMSDHETAHKRLCRCGHIQIKQFCTNQECEVTGSRWVNASK